MGDFRAKEVLDSEYHRIGYRHNSETSRPNTRRRGSVEKRQPPRIEIHAGGPYQAAGENPFSKNPILLEISKRFAHAGVVETSVRPEPPEHRDPTHGTDHPICATGR